MQRQFLLREAYAKERSFLFNEQLQGFQSAGFSRFDLHRQNKGIDRDNIINFGGAVFFITGPEKEVPLQVTIKTSSQFLANELLGDGAGVDLKEIIRQ